MRKNGDNDKLMTSLGQVNDKLMNIVKEITQK